MNILCYSQNENNYKLEAVYYGLNNKIKIIPLKFVSNNHFEILYPKNYFLPIKKIDIDYNYLKNITKECTNNNVDIKSLPTFFFKQNTAYQILVLY